MHDTKDDIWQTHSMKFLEMAFRTDYHEKVLHADGHGRKARDCGDTIDFFLVGAPDAKGDGPDDLVPAGAG